MSKVVFRVLYRTRYGTTDVMEFNICATDMDFTRLPNALLEMIGTRSFKQKYGYEVVSIQVISKY